MNKSLKTKLALVILAFACAPCVRAQEPAAKPSEVVRERRATFAATPVENAKRPPTQTAWRNLFLAGDWTATGLPATIEGAIRSGHRAAQCVMQSKAI